MANDNRPRSVKSPLLKALTRTNTLAGLMFIAVAVAGLWFGRELNFGTARRMGAGFMPQMLCWFLMGLGAIVMLQGLFERDPPGAASIEVEIADEPPQNLLSIFWVGASMVAFALLIEPFGLVVAIAALVLIASFAYRGIRWWETILTAVFMTALCWAVFVLGLGISVKVWPEGLPWTF